MGSSSIWWVDRYCRWVRSLSFRQTWQRDMPSCSGVGHPLGRLSNLSWFFGFGIKPNVLWHSGQTAFAKCGPTSQRTTVTWTNALQNWQIWSSSVRKLIINILIILETLNPLPHRCRRHRLPCNPSEYSLFAYSEPFCQFRHLMGLYFLFESKSFWCVIKFHDNYLLPIHYQYIDTMSREN